ncbi:MAG TPA: phytoene/squalene synthase family protein [Anaeromyxobacteraceae bacterium]|nr:phytoene/squalene synthase family protein [Anaeromyxobacteraceae bacterium]
MNGTITSSTNANSAALVRRGQLECWEILRKHGKTFHMMAVLLGPERGNAIASLYGFARVADDAVDEPQPWDTAHRIREQLRWMQAELRRAVMGRSEHPRFAALGDAVRRYDVPLEPFDDLIAGVEMDLERTHFGTFSDLELYCYRVAGTVGLMITPVAGYRPGSDALAHAKTLGTAMQLTNILRDVGEDLLRGRVYLPEEDLQFFGLTEADLHARAHPDRFRKLMEFEIARARRLYDEGLALIPLLSNLRGRGAFRFAVDAYSAILDKIRANEFDVFGRRAHLSSSEKLALVPACALRAWRAGGAVGVEGRSSV